MFEVPIKKYLGEVLALNDYLAEHPEIGSEEVHSSKKHVELLRKYGIKTIYPYNEMKTAFRGIINEGKKPRLGILVEYDALRGLGHACGHCASGAMSTLAALMLNDVKDKIPGEINIIGTPDEEILGGKVYMVEDGVFKGIEAVIMIHMNDKTAAYVPFLAMAAYNFEFKGTPAHAAAAPWEGKNALNALRLVFDGLDMMRQHVTPDVRIHGYIQDGGKASNIVPDFAKAEFCFRALTDKGVEYVIDWAKDVGEGAALITKTEFKWKKLGAKFFDLSSKPTGERYIKELLEKNGYSCSSDHQQPGGSSDIGNVDSVCPAFHPMITTGYSYKPHTVEFAETMKTKEVHNSIRAGGLVIAEFIARCATDKEFLNSIKEEHRKSRGWA